MLIANVAILFKASLLGALASLSPTSPGPGPEGAPSDRVVTQQGGAEGQAGPPMPGDLEAPLDVSETEALYWEEDFSRSGGLFGISENFDAGYGCGNWQRTRYEATVVSGKANCYVIDWVSDDPKDCRVRVHIGIAALGGATCRVQVYVDI